MRSGSSPMHFRSLDLGEEFDLLLEHIKTMGLATGDGKVSTSDAAKMPRTNVLEGAVESMSQKRRRRAGKTAKNEAKVNGYRRAFLKLATNPGVEDKEDDFSKNTQFYTPSV